MKKLSFFELLIMGVGQIIGSGIMVLLCIAIGMTGKGVAISFAVAGIIVIIPTISIAALGSAIPNAGGMYTYVRDLIGKKTAFFYVALLVFGQFILAQYAIGFADYAKELFPFINVHIVAAIMMTFVFLVNIVGLKSSVFLQRFVVSILVLSLLAFVGFGLPQVNDFTSFFTLKNTIPQGIGNFLAASVLVRYALIGAEFLSEFGGDSKNPGRDIPYAMLASTFSVSVLYLFIAIVAAGVLPIEEVAFKNLGIVAKKILPNWMYLVFMIGGGMAALLSSLNAVFAWATKGIKAAINDGWLPKKLAQENKMFKTPHWLLLMYYIAGMIPIILGQEIRAISVIGTNIGLIFSIFPVIAVMFLLKKNPDAYEKAAFKLPKWAMYVIPVISIVIYIIGFMSSYSYLKEQGAIIPMFIFCLVVLIYAWWKEPRINK
ncbi:APC family permease [Caviibacter abscessus]|uniref:APC family permease n=1 Tax=Caviibacter abscessus TaxID=1766719 RepID=UPI000837205A|nr:APC family permease [Caviibacter abscessus]